jgi:hypothetical protein
MGETLWTDNRLRLLVDLHEMGLSVQRIADKLGGDLTRNAVIDKLAGFGITCPERRTELVSQTKFRPSKSPHVNRITLPGKGS